MFLLINCLFHIKDVVQNRHYGIEHEYWFEHYKKINSELNTISYSIFLVFDIRGLGIVKTVYLSTVIDLE